MRLYFLIMALLIALPAQAEKIKYYQDPVYKQLNGQDPHPMNDLLSLAKGGDARAQFILGDLYAKGKGGLTKSAKQAKTWFETSAKNGYSPSFIRLGALAKRTHDPMEAWQWYTLASEQGRSEDRRYASSARDALEKDAKMSREDITKARQLVTDWKKQKAKGQQARAEKEKLDKRRAAVAEEAVKEPVKKTVEKDDAPKEKSNDQN